MNEKMLIQKIDTSGMSRNDIAEAIGVSRQGLYNKISGAKEFKMSEIKKLADILHLSAKDRDAIFFADAVDKSVH